MKAAGHFVGAIMAALFFAAYTVERLLMGPDRAFAGASEELAKISGYTGVYVRQAFYRWTIAHVGVDAYIGFMTLLSKRQARIGDRAYIGRMCTIGWAEIGDDVMIADGVQVLSGRHTHGSAAQEGRTLHDNALQFTKVTIGKGAWIGAGAIIMADVGERAVVGAGAVVVKPVPPGAKVGGVPARPLGSSS